MKLTVLQEDFAKAVNIASRFASPKAQLPILGNILISSEKTKVRIVSTNLEISASVSLGAKVEEEGEISIPSKVLNDLVSNLPKETIEISSKEEQLKVSSPGFSSNVLGMSAVDFPKVPAGIDKSKAVPLPSKEFSDALSKVTFAASMDETRPVLTGVLFIKDKKNLNLVATDGFRLSKKTVNVENDDEFKLILPKLILNEVARDSSSEMFFSFDQNDKQAVFSSGDITLTSRLLEGEYPDFDKIIPKNSSLSISVDKEDFLRAVKLASVFAREASNIVKIKVLKESIKVSAESGSSGSQEMSVEAKIQINEKGNENMEVSFNYKFLEDFLNSIKSDTLTIDLSGPSSAGVFREASDLEYLHLIMPVRVQS